MTKLTGIRDHLKSMGGREISKNEHLYIAIYIFFPNFMNCGNVVSA